MVPSAQGPLLSQILFPSLEAWRSRAVRSHSVAE